MDKVHNILSQIVSFSATAPRMPSQIVSFLSRLDSLTRPWFVKIRDRNSSTPNSWTFIHKIEQRRFGNLPLHRVQFWAVLWICQSHQFLRISEVDNEFDSVRRNWLSNDHLRKLDGRSAVSDAKRDANTSGIWDNGQLTAYFDDELQKSHFSRDNSTITDTHRIWCEWTSMIDTH
jgi:hypothetical protein